MTTERLAWASLHVLEPSRQTVATCHCGQDLDTCTGHHCPRCGSSIAVRAA
jgi:predicted RNA-binding Zn-ribbon protein involved in translation (DUF1610 family)